MNFFKLTVTFLSLFMFSNNYVSYISEGRVTLKPGFRALNGSKFKAFIGYCGNTFTQNNHRPTLSSNKPYLNIKTQDILGGMISSKPISGLTYEISVFLYTKTSISGDHLGISTVLTNDVTEWEYSFIKTFPGIGTYNITVNDSFRVANIMNIVNSSSKSILLQQDLNVNSFFPNNSPILQSKQNNISVIDGNFIYNPNAIDPDGDSLSYSLVPVPVSNYTFPLGAKIDAITGTFSMPVSFGSYSVAIKIDEWRNNINVGTITSEITVVNDYVTNLSKELKVENFKIYPNPSKGIFVVEFPTLKGLSDIIILDVMGKQIYSRQILGNRMEIDISQFSKGIYSVLVNSDSGLYSQKVIKN